MTTTQTHALGGAGVGAGTPAVELAGVHRRYGTAATATVALAGIDLCIERGEFVAIEGPSGSGKSTLLHLIAGLDLPDEGNLHVLGRDIARLSETDRTRLRAADIGILLQRYDLLSNLTATENAAIPGILAHHARSHARKRAIDLLTQLGLGDHLDHRPGQLSGGQQQRTCLARALYRNPAIVIADEPTAALDTATGDDILGVLRDLNRAGTTIILATHDPRASATATRSIRLIDGQITGA